MKRLSALLLLLALSAPAFAQQNVFTLPYPAPSNGSTAGVIVSTNTFQQAIPAFPTRRGCTIQNNGTNNMRVFIGAIGSASTTNSFILAAGQSLNCNSGPIILNDAVNITGTSGDAFVWSQQ